MKRFKLSTQLIFVFLFIVLLSGGLFFILARNRIGDISTDITLNRLTSMAEASKNQWADRNEENFELDSNNLNISYIRYVAQYDESGNKNFKSYVSSNISDIISIQDVELLLKDINLIPGFHDSKVREFPQSGKIYYSYMISNNDCGIIIITNSAYANQVTRSLAFSIYFIFFIIIVLAAIVIFIWSNYYTTRLFRLNSYVKSLPKNNYDGEYIDDGKDEISQLSNTIEEMRKILKKSENDKREMLQNLSHDFKTPIAVIKSYAEAIKDGVEDTEDGLNTILMQTDILRAKVVKLLEYNKLEYLTKDKEFEEISMKDIINNVVSNYKHQQSIKIELDLDESKFMGYEENYYTVIENILDNANRYAKNIIKINLKNGVLSIYNDGEPIDEKFVNGLFKAYEKGSKGQFGLGMSIVKKTLDFFGYEINVKNEEIGVTFTINRKPNSNVLAL